jgi:putative glycosyltransferase (TIGR04372 family)
VALISERRRALLRVTAAVVRDRLKQRGLLWLVAGLGRRIAVETLWVASLPVALVLHLVGFRCVIVRSEHIGHLTTELDAFFKEQRLGLLAPRRWFMTAPPGRVSNEHLLGYWSRFLPVVVDPALCAVLDVVCRRGVARYDLARYVAGFIGTQDIYRINRLWAERPPLLALTAADEAWARTALPALGIPEGTWFVCVHVREGGFLPHNELIQSHRNARIENCLEAMKEVVARGGLCVRMGDPSMEPLAAIPGVIDYAHHPAKSAKMDVVLCARARLFLGCTSGLAFLSGIFGVPVAHANMIPVATLGLRPGDVSIPKTIWSQREQRLLSFAEILGTGIGDYFFTHQYQDAGLVPIENSPADILGLLAEALDRIEAQFVEEPGDAARHRLYLGLFRPGHYAYGAASRVGLAFLRRHEALIG